MKGKPGQVIPKRRWLCIAYAFPPINRSGTHRTAAFVRGLDALGWQADVLTVVPPAQEPTDASLMSIIPEGTQVVAARWSQPVEVLRRRLRAMVGSPRNAAKPVQTTAQAQQAGEHDQSFARVVAALLATPDSRTGWILPAVWKGLGVIRRRRPEVMYSTSPYASAHLIALVLHRLTGVPWVADFRDPWCGNPFQQPRSRIVERLDAWLERLVLKHASSVVCNTPTLAKSFATRHPGVRQKVSTILNGIDAATLRNIRPHRLAPAGHFVFLHCGQFYGPRSPHVLFEGFRRLLLEFPCQSERVRLALLGPPVFQGQSLADMASKAGLADRVIVCGEKPHAKALELSIGADALVLVGALGPGSELQVPQKLFEYLALRRPILGLLSPDNPAAAILEDAQADGVVCDAGEPAAVAKAMRHLIDPSRVPSPDAWCGVHLFDRGLRVAELDEIFQGLVGRSAAQSKRNDPESYAAASSAGESDARAKRNTTTASSNIKAANTKRIKATHATLLPPAP